MIEANNLKRQYELFQSEYEDAVLRVLRSGWYILGNECKAFEESWADYIGAKYCVGLASGLDALQVAFRVLNIGKGDEVIVAANAYIACVMGITMNGAIPVFVEPDDTYNIDCNRIEEKITKKTKAILAVHLFGQCCDMTKIMDIASSYNLKVVEDCAQSHGSLWSDKMAGSFGDIACFSYYPTKGCGAFGDGGSIVTNNLEYAEFARTIRNYGSEEKYHNKLVGMNSRLDEIQASLLSVKLRHLEELNSERTKIAEKYNKEIVNNKVKKPIVRENAFSTWHQYVIKMDNRDSFTKAFERK